MERRWSELVRGAAALVLLIGVVAGLPAILVILVGWPLPTEMPTWDGVRQAIEFGYVESWTLIKAIAVVTWLAWANLAASVVAEAVALVRGRRARRVPAPGALQAVAANLVAAAAVLLTSLARPAAGDAAETSGLRGVVAEAPYRPAVGEPGIRVATHGLHAVPEPPTEAAGDVPRDGPVWTVRPRDTLWGIAERTVGNGLRWQEIQRLNAGRPQPDGDALSPSDDHIRPGWVLLLPPDADVEAIPDEQTARPDMDGDGAAITVEPGDTLWHLAEEHLGDPFRWPEIYEANRGRPQPDGRRLTDPDLIHPGWTLDLPASDVTAGDDLPAAHPEVQRHDPPAPEHHHLDGEELDDDQGQPPREVPRDEAVPRLPAAPPPAQSGPTDAPGHASEQAGEVDTRARALVAISAGLVAAGIAATLDRIRRAQRRRRPPGRRIPLPDGPAAATELRIRGLADTETASLLGPALSSLLASQQDRDRPVPDIVLVSTSASDLAVHLADPDPDPPVGWRCENDGLTWVRDRADLAEINGTEDRADAIWTGMLVSLGTSADGHRRVLLNLAHAGLLRIDADEETRRSAMLGQAIELATATVGLGVRVILCGFGALLEPLERITVVDDSETAVRLLERTVAINTSGGDAVDPVPVEEQAVALFGSPVADELTDKVAGLLNERRGVVAAVLPGDGGTPWTMRQVGDRWHIEPHGLELEPLELTSSDLEQVGELVRIAKSDHYVDPPQEHEPTVEADASEEARSPADDSSREACQIEVRILGPVDVDGAGTFDVAKAEELVVYLAMHRQGMDSDALMEALWPGEPPKSNRFQKVISRARAALGDAPDGDSLITRAKHGRYTLSPVVQFDYERFRALVSCAREEQDRRLELLHQALELVRGRPFGAISSGYAWATHDMYAIAHEVADIAHELAQHYLDAGDLAQASWAAKQGLKAEQHCEPLYRDLMEVAAQSGNTAHVHDVMRDLRSTVADEAEENDADDYLDPETIRLYEKLTRGGWRTDSGK